MIVSPEHDGRSDNGLGENRRSLSSSARLVKQLLLHGHERRFAQQFDNSSKFVYTQRFDKVRYIRDGGGEICLRQAEHNGHTSCNGHVREVDGGLDASGCLSLTRHADTLAGKVMRRHDV